MIVDKVSIEVQKIINYYDDSIKSMDKIAKTSKGRAYGGVLRAKKGELVENLARSLFMIAWNCLDRKSNKLKLERKTIRIPLKKDYINKIESPEVRKYIRESIGSYYYPLTVDLLIYIDEVLGIAVECKAYTENAMLKRILVDFTLLRNLYPNLYFLLFQLESQLGGDYSNIKKTKYGSPSTHTLLSYFDIDLNIITLLEGERSVNRPVHKIEYYKPLKKESILIAIEVMKDLLKRCM